MNGRRAEVDQTLNPRLLGRLEERSRRPKNHLRTSGHRMNDDVAARKSHGQGMWVESIGHPAVQVKPRQTCGAGGGSHDGPDFRQAANMQHLDDATPNKTVCAQDCDDLHRLRLRHQRLEVRSLIVSQPRHIHERAVTITLFNQA